MDDYTCTCLQNALYHNSVDLGFYLFNGANYLCNNGIVRLKMDSELFMELTKFEKKLLFISAFSNRGKMEVYEIINYHYTVY